MRRTVKAVILATGLATAFGVYGANYSSLVYPGSSGKLAYTTYANEGQTNAVNTVPDYSMCGYKGGGVSIPYVPVKVTVSPSPGDDRKNIQDAIDDVASLPLDANGFRGAVLLTAGDYQSSGTIYLDVDGVVLRGEGQQDSGGTKITCTASSQITFIRMGDYTATRTELPSTRVAISDGFVPTGATHFNVSDASGFSVGDDIAVLRHANDKWVSDLDADVFTINVSGDEVPWDPQDYEFHYERVITAINGNEITIDVPLVQAIEDQYGGGSVYKYSTNRKQNIGLENLRLESTYASDTDEAHGWTAIRVDGCENGWVRQVTARYFGYGCVNIDQISKYITVEDCAMLDPKSITTGGRKYPFNVADGQFLLLQRCYSRGGRHDYATGAQVPGPAAFVDCVAEQTFADTGPHHRYAHGLLFDNINCGDLQVYYRGGYGTGHGWPGAQTMFWNCYSDGLVRVDSPPAARNWGIGCIGASQAGAGFWESWGTRISDPRSLYYTQLKDRLGTGALRNAILPDQEESTIWTALSSWAGEGLFGSNVVAWTSSSLIMPPTNTVALTGRIRNLQMLDNGATSVWQKVSGPGSVTFADATTNETTASFSSAGVYVLRLTVGDGSTIASADVQLRYGNNAPVVNAGTNQTVFLTGSRTWTPAEIATAAWYDASDTNSVLASGGSVSNWLDKSGNNHHLSQANAGAQPATASRTINGLNALDLDGNDSLATTASVVGGNPDLMIVAVRVLDSNVSGNDMIASLGDGTGGRTVAIAGGSNGYSWRFFDGNEVYGSVTLGTTNIQMGIRTSGSDYMSSQMWLDGTQLSRSGGSGDANTPNITTNMNVCGVGGYIDGAVGEILVLEDASPATRQKIEGYLAHKWGLTASLPVGHPYTSSAPEGSATATLAGAVSDADGDPLTTTWTQVSGPASVMFANTSAVETVVSFFTNGVYTLRLTANDGFGQTYDECIISVEDSDLFAPTSLSAAAVSATQIDLAWVDNSTNETGFVVERSSSSGSGFGPIGSAAENATNYTDNAVGAGETWYYRVTATNFVGSSAPSAEASATTPSLPAAAVTNTFQIGNTGHINFSAGVGDNQTRTYTMVDTNDAQLSITVTIQTGDSQDALVPTANTLAVDSSARQTDDHTGRISLDETVTLSVSVNDPNGSLALLKVKEMKMIWLTGTESGLLFDGSSGYTITNDLVFSYDTTGLEQLSVNNWNTWSLTLGAGSGSQIGLNEFEIEYTTGTVPYYDLWASGWGLVAGVNDALDADVEPGGGDGLVNLLEYALGADPLAVDASAYVPTYGMAVEGGTNYLNYVYRRRRDTVVRGLTYTVGSTTNLADAGFAGGTEEVGSGIIDSDFESVTNRVSTDVESTQFMRLKVELH